LVTEHRAVYAFERVMDGCEEILKHLTQDSHHSEPTIRTNVASPLSGIGNVLPRTVLQASPLSQGTLWRASSNIVRSELTQERATPWWLWWNLLSLDAPTVSIVWALLFAYFHGTRLSFADEIILSLTVWAIYTGDRLLDGWTVKNRKALQHRHLFCAMHRRLLIGFVALAAVGSLWATSRYLAPRQVIAGTILGMMVGVYMAAIHAGDRRMERFVSKEVVVGVLFATGTTLPIWSQACGLSWGEWASFALFALICSLNCLSIECWENSHCENVWHEKPLFLRWANSRINFIATGLAASSIVILFLFSVEGTSTPILYAIFPAALLILLLNLNRSELSPEALRVLADAALVIPAIVALLIRK
jgi:hypothetical protein